MIDRRTLCITAGAVLAATTTPQAATAIQPSFKIALGPHAPKSAPALSFRVDPQDKDLNIRVTYPDSPGPHPVIVFSHGALSSKDLYHRITDHWASHGYATILPTHLDSESLGYSFKNPLPRDKVFFGRIGDMTFILDSLEAIATKAGISGRLDGTRIAAAGHSFGGWMALIMAGLPVTMPDGTSKSFRDERVKAMIAYNGIGPMDQIGNEGWRDVKIPVFAASGTNDPGATGDGTMRPWRWRIGAYDLAGSKEKYAVSITMGDHYYGGLICREGAGGKPDPEGLSFVNGASTAFLDAYLKADPAARKFLRTADLRPLTNGRAFLERV
jgi:predicted dienelactone hydrolase